MAFCPRGALPLENKVGLAPGVFIETRQMTIIALPDEPFEARSVFSGNTLATRLKLLLAGLGYADEVVELESNDEASAIDIVKHVKMQHPDVVIAVRGGMNDHSPVLRLHLCAWTEEPEKPAGEAKPAPEFPRTGSRAMPSVGSGSKPMMTVTVAELESAGARTLRARARAQELIAHAIADLEQEVMSIRNSDDESRPEVKIGMRRRAPEYR
jgi:molybdopterin-biosynthesis enzyme MoeA-like protein